MEERNQISLEELTEKIDNRIEKIYSLILKMEDALEEQKKYLITIFQHIEILELNSRTNFAEIKALRKET